MLTKHNEEVLVPIDDDVNKKNHFKGFPFEGDVQDVTNAFNKFGCQNSSKLFEQFFLESIKKVNL